MVKKTETLPPDAMIPEFPVQTPARPPVDVTPLMVKTVVSVKATVPLVQYGNVEMFVSQEFFTPADTPQVVRDEMTHNNLTRLRELLVDQVEPMAEADILAAKPVLLKEVSPDAWMQRQNSVYRWLRVASPDRRLQAMEEIVHDESRLALVSKSRVR